MSECIHGDEFEACIFGCTFRNREELKVENDKLQGENKRLKARLTVDGPIEGDAIDILNMRLDVYKAENKWLKELAKLRDDLLVCYRVGKKPIIR